MTWEDYARGALGAGEPGPGHLGTAATGRSTVTSAVAVLVAVLVLSLAVCAPVSVAASAAEKTAAAENTAEDPATAAREHAASARPEPFGLSIGARAGYVPVAKGIDAWKPLLMPRIEARLGHRVVLGTGGLAVRLVGVSTGDDAAEAQRPLKIRVTALLLPNVGRYDEHLPEAYDGMSDVPATAEAGLDVGVRLWKGLEATTRVTADALGRGHGGSYAAVGARWCGGMSGAGLTWTLGADVVAGTRDYMQAYYGVSERQAARTSFDSYDASAGIEAVRAHVALALPLGPRITVASETTAMLFMSQAGRSPLVRATEQAATHIVVTYGL